MTDKIDFIITWVDSNDLKWREQKQQYELKYGIETSLNSEIRYRDWELLKYWFRSVEKHAPWVNKIHFVTEGHLPEWLNVNHEKLNIVKHSDYIDSEYLPTFNSNVIELNLHKIKELGNYFVNFNDDLFLNRDVTIEDFFINGTPRDAGVFSPLVPTRGTIGANVLNNVEIINDYFSARKVIKNSFLKFFNLKYGKHLIKNFCVLPWSKILGFYDSHVTVSYRKDICKMVYDKEQGLFDKNNEYRFRTKNDITLWLVRYWQICSGNFVPRSTRFGQYYNLSDDNKKILEDIRKSEHAVICLNDSDSIKDFERVKKELLAEFELKYPQKSLFEI